MSPKPTHRLQNFKLMLGLPSGCRDNLGRWTFRFCDVHRIIHTKAKLRPITPQHRMQSSLKYIIEKYCNSNAFISSHAYHSVQVVRMARLYQFFTTSVTASEVLYGIINLVSVNTALKRRLRMLPLSRPTGENYL